MKRLAPFLLLTTVVSSYSYASVLNTELLKKGAELAWVKYKNSAPITAVFVYSVVSTGHPNIELVEENQRATKHHHSGEIRVQTIDIGYAKTNSAKMDGKDLPQFSLINTQQLCRSGDGRLHFCALGEEVAGYLNTWSMKNGVNANFLYQATSDNYPWNTEYAQLYIN